MARSARRLAASAGRRGSVILAVAIIAAMLGVVTALHSSICGAAAKQARGGGGGCGGARRGDVAVGIVPGVPCAAAASLAGANGAIAHPVRGGRSRRHGAGRHPRSRLLGAPATATAGPPGATHRLGVQRYFCVYGVPVGASVPTQLKHGHCGQRPYAEQSFAMPRITTKTRGVRCPARRSWSSSSRRRRRRRSPSTWATATRCRPRSGTSATSSSPRTCPPELKKGSLGKFSVDVENGFEPYYVVSDAEEEDGRRAQARAQGRRRALPRN